MEYQIPITLTVTAKSEGEAISLVRQLERRAGWKPSLPIELVAIGIGQMKQMPSSPSGPIKVIEVGDSDWFKPGIHLTTPSPVAIENAKEDAINKGFDTVYVHRIEKPPMTKRR